MISQYTDQLQKKKRFAASKSPCIKFAIYKNAIQSCFYQKNAYCSKLEQFSFTMCVDCSASLEIKMTRDQSVRSYKISQTACSYKAHTGVVKNFQGIEAFALLMNLRSPPKNLHASQHPQEHPHEQTAYCTFGVLVGRYYRDETHQVRRVF